MDTMTWIPAISTTLLLAIVLWLARSLISNRLARSVQHEFDGKLESLRTENRKSEEAFRSELKAKDVQIELLKGSAISGLASRQALLDKRRIEAVEELWAAVHQLAPAKLASAWMATIKFEPAAKESARNPRFRQMFEAIGGSFDMQTLGRSQAFGVRPFVSEMSWAVFSAYQAITLHSVTQMMMLKHGVDQTDLLDTNKLTELVRTVLPHRSEYLQKHGASGCYYLLDELESMLLTELRRMLKGEESDQQSLEQAARILSEADRVFESVTEARLKSPDLSVVETRA